MPYLKIETNRKIPYRMQFIKSATHHLSEILNAPEAKIMVSVQDEHEMRFGLCSDGAAYVQLKCVDLPEDCQKIVDLVSSFVEQSLKIPQERIYVECENLNKNYFALNGECFSEK